MAFERPPRFRGFAGLFRRLSSDARGRATKLPAHVTNAAQQAAQAQQLYSQSVAGNKAQLAQTPNGGDPNDGDPALQSLMQANMAPQANPSALFQPGAPLRPAIGIEPTKGARQWSFPVGYNIASLPRSTESTSFAQLRTISLLYDAVQLCEQVYFDIFGRLELHVGFEEGVVPDGESENDKKWRAVAAPAQEWLAYPDECTPVTDWMCASFRDVAELGQSPVFLPRNRKGEILRLELVDGVTIKPLIDDRGRQPRPPFPSYQQFLWGVPGGRYTSNQIYMLRETARSDSVYPISRVERILMRIDMGLRKQNLDLTRYTDGAIPEGWLFPAADNETEWTAERQEDLEQTLNSLLAGNDVRRVRLKVGPPGAKFVNTRPADPQTDFDRFLMTICAACFGLTLDELAMTETSNRSTGQTQQNVVYRRAVEPAARRFASFFTRIIKQKFDTRLIVRWSGMEEPEDILTKAQTLNIGVQAGALSPSRMARMLRWPVDVEVPPFIKGPGEPIFLNQQVQLMEQQTQAKKKGLELAIKGATAGAAPAPGGKPPLPGAPPQPTPPPGQGQTAAGGKAPAGAKPPTPQPKEQPNGPPQPVPRALAPEKGDQERGAASLEAIRADYRRWYEVAKKAASAGRPVPAFASQVIPLEDYALLRADLVQARDLEAVRAAFQASRERAG